MESAIHLEGLVGGFEYRSVEAGLCNKAPSLNVLGQPSKKAHRRLNQIPPLKICAPILFCRIVRLQSQDSPDQDHRGFAGLSYRPNHSILGKKMCWCGELWPYSNITTWRAGSSKERDGITHVAPSPITSTSVRAADSYIPRCTNRSFGRLAPRISTLDLCTL